MPNIVDPTIPNYPPQGIQAQLDLLYLYNPDVAQKLIDQLNAGLADMEEFKKELEKALKDLQGVLRYKGSVETEADLPTEGNVTGDVWNITSTDENVAWDGTKWDKFGSAIDTSVFLTKTDAANTYLPLTGGALSGRLFVTNELILRNKTGTRSTQALLFDNESRLQLGGISETVAVGGSLISNFTSSYVTLGDRSHVWSNVHTKKLNNGADLNVPTEGGTLARLEDIPAQEVTSVNTKKGDVVLTGADINATLTGTGDPVTTTVTDHLQTLKNDETELGNQVSGIQSLIPSDASETNLLATKADITSGLPDQTGNGGKFLTTDGEAASWSYPYTVGGESHRPCVAGLGSEVSFAPSEYGSLWVGKQTAKSYSGDISLSTAVGFGATVGSSCTALGANSKAGGILNRTYTVGCIAIGSGANAIGNGSVQIGYGTNNNPDTIQWKSITLVNADGTIPTARLAADGTTGQVLSKTDTGMQWVDMSGGVSEVFHDDSLSGKGTETEPLSVARPAAIIREW